MPLKSLRVDIDEAELAVAHLTQEVERKTNNPELRQEYHTLLKQITAALNKIRSIAENDDYIRGFEWQ